MIPEEPNYGWGAGGLPMPLEVVRTSLRPAPSISPVLFVRDLPWRGLLGSVLLTVTALAILLYLASHLPPVALRPQTVQVKITVRLPEPAVRVSASPEQPPPPPKPPEAPPRVKPVRTPPPEMKAQSVPEIAKQRPAPDPALPTMAAAASDRQIPVEVAREPRPEPEFPRADRTVQLGGDEAVLLGPGPDLRPRTERPAKDALPERGSVVLGSPAALEPASMDPGLPRQHYRANGGESGTAEPVRQATLRVKSGEANLDIAPVSNMQRFQGSTAADSLPAGRAAATILGGDPAEVLPLPLAAAKPKEAPAVASLPAGAGTSFDHLDRLAPADLDGRYLVSLNRLHTCRDPQAEMKLRTRLAALVRKPGSCRTGGVVFAILQPETAWSLHIDIYDFEQRELQDRCAALRLAAECLEGVRR